MVKEVTPLNEKQKQLLAALSSEDIDIVGVFGPSGTGKSFLTCAYALNALESGKYPRFIIIRPVVDVNSGKRYSSVELGNLFFDISSSYLFDLTTSIMSQSSIKEMIDQGKILFADPSFLSGRTFDNTLIFLDDSQHVPPEVVLEAVLRIGNRSKLVIAGDPVFQAPHPKNGATIAREVLWGQERSFIVDFGTRDIIRPGAKRAFKLALEAKVRIRDLSEEEKKLYDLIYSYAPDAQIITVFDLRSLKKRYDIKTSPDAIIISKEGYLGRLIGKGGERINKIEKESGISLRGIELSLDFKHIIAAIHPISWIKHHMGEVDVVGTSLEVEVDTENFGAFIGQGGVFVRFLDEVFRGLLGVGVKVKGVELSKDKERKVRRK